MDLPEIETYLYASAAHSVRVDVRELVQLPGYLRTVTIHSDLSVAIEVLPFGVCVAGNREGGYPKYVGRYGDLETLVASLEKYLASPVANWGNSTQQQSVANAVVKAKPASSLSDLEDVVRRREISLPSEPRFLNMALPWRHIERYGEFRADKVEEEEDMLWQEGVHAGLFEPDE